jgi:excisionase family DNA binding protein
MEMEPSKLEELMTVDEVAARLKWHRNTVYNRVHRNSIPFVKIGRSVRFKPAEIDRWITEQTADAA